MPPVVAVLDYGAGNLRSAQKALARVGAEAVVTDDAASADRADALLVPGVGHFGQCVGRFRQAGFEALVRSWADRSRPVLGVCVGMQILYGSSEEDPGVPGLGLLRGHVRRLPPGVTVPHMGWNTLTPVRDDPLVDGLAGAHFYFVHSYYAQPEGDDPVVATCAYGPGFPAVVRRGSVAGTQFHPEKSGAAGGRLLRNWVEAVVRERGIVGAR